MKSFRNKQQDIKRFEETGTLYCPYTTKTVATIVNGVVIWDERWYANLWYQFINRIIPKRRRIIKNFKEFSKKKVSSEFYTPINQQNND